MTSASRQISGSSEPETEPAEVNWDSLGDVEGLGLDLLLDNVLQNDLAGNALGHAGVSEGGADSTGGR